MTPAEVQNWALIVACLLGWLVAAIMYRSLKRIGHAVKRVDDVLGDR